MLHQISSSGTERFLLAAAVGSSLGFGAGPLFAVVHVPFGGPLPFLGPTCNDPEGCNTGQDFVFNVAIVEEYVAINSGTLTYALPEAVVPEPHTQYDVLGDAGPGFASWSETLSGKPSGNHSLAAGACTSLITHRFERRT